MASFLSKSLRIVSVNRHRFAAGQLANHRSYSSSSSFDPICELAASNLRFGPGATAEVGLDLKEGFKAKNVVVVTDATVANLPCMEVLLESLETHQVKYEIYDEVRVEPNDVSFRHAMEFLTKLKKQGGGYDAVVTLGGGSVMDTAKAANLYATLEPGDFYDHVNPPLGKGLPIPMNTKLPPLIAIPTTAGTGSETTGVAIFDDTPTRSKTGIANRALKPNLGIVDPKNTETLPKRVATYAGLDVLCHAIESYTAIPHSKRPGGRPNSPLLRPAYQGSNPISDVWAMMALELCAKHLPRAVREGDEHSRSQMLLASSVAGIGFGNAGVHLCHGMSYPISSQVPSTYKGDSGPTSGYPTDHALIPHGLSVIVSAPSVFEWTAEADYERHATCARILSAARGGSDDYTDTMGPEFAGKWLADEIRDFLSVLDVELGIKQFGYKEGDLPALVEGTMPQHRVTKIAPRPVGREELQKLFENVYNDE